LVELEITSQQEGEMVLNIWFRYFKNIWFGFSPKYLVWIFPTIFGLDCESQPAGGRNCFTYMVKIFHKIFGLDCRQKATRQQE
jgi:hypothetical protein